MKFFKARRLISFLCAAGILTVSSQVMAGAFQLFEQDGASPGNDHAGYAAIAEDASTAFYNPAGIVRFKNQQLVFAGNAVATDFKYNGTVAVNTLGNTPQPTVAQGGGFAFLPAMHYVAPLTERLGFGFSVDVPFGLRTNYGYTSLVKYASTQSSVTVVDISPSFAYLVTDKGSIGAGLDIQKMYAEFDSVGVIDVGFPDEATSTNKASDTAAGYHLGALYQFSKDTRLGLSYHSKVVHHLSGSSLFSGQLATDLNGVAFSSHANTNVTLPPYTALSFYKRVHPEFAFMASAIYTQWNVMQSLVLNNLSGVLGTAPNQTIQVTIPEFYRNTWNLSVGGNYYPTDQIIIRSGIGYDQTPTTGAFRTVALPDNNRYVIALGGHYQATKTIGLDLNWMHLFVGQTRVNPPPQVTGDQVTTVNGTAKGGADVLGGQITWDLA